MGVNYSFSETFILPLASSSAAFFKRTLRMKSCGVQPSTAIPLISPAFLHF
jgi:hypothetical protein